MGHLDSAEYYSASKKEENSDTPTTWVTPEDILLREVCWSREDRRCVIPFT